MDSNTVATAHSESIEVKPQIEATEKVDPMGTAIKESDDMPLEIYTKENRKDYVIDALDVGEDIENLPNELTEGLTQISEYIKGRMRNESYEPTTKAYKSMLSKVKKEVGLDNNVALEGVVDRLTGYIDSLNTLRSIKSLNDIKVIKALRQAKSKKEMTDIVMKTVEKIIK